VAVQVVDLGAGTATVTVVPAPDAPEYVDPPGTAVLRVEATTQAPEEPPEDRSHEVRPGDHLWSIAEAEVALASGGATDQDAIQRHWHRILLANSQVEDPDLLFPGDVITLPPVGHTG
jgi:nucleoid-associated protein YgaU